MPAKPIAPIQPPLLRTKIVIPQIPPEFVHRPRLTERIDRGVVRPLTLLLAPAGYGKTNLIIEWARQASLPVAWFTIDGDDNDLNRFFRYLTGALQTVEPGLTDEALDFILSTRSGALEVGWTLLINEIAALSREFVLVLDDFHTLENPTILQGIGFLLKQLPPNLHLILASRNELTLDLAFLRAKGRVVELGVDDLRFTGEEIAQFFAHATGLQLPPETIALLEERTDGWITALQMAAISLRHQTEPNTLLANLQGHAHYLVDFLAEEVLDRQPEDIRQFLLHTSVLESLTGSLCEAVAMPEAQPGYGAVMLSRLEHANLFITALDEEHEWYRYHHLFADFLRHILAEIAPATIPVLQKRAALWFERNGNLNEACRYALACGDMEWTADLIERNVAAMVMSGEITSLTHLLGKLPEESIHRRPGLGLTYAWGLTAAFQLDHASQWIDVMEQILVELETKRRNAPDGDTATDDDEELSLIRGGLAICQSFLAALSGNSEQAAEFSKQAAGYLGEENPFIHSLINLEESLYHILSGDTQKAIASLRDTIHVARQANNLLVMIIATCQLADMQALQGKLSQAWTTLQKVKYMAVGPDGKPLALAGLANVGFGEILLERDSLAEASTFLEKPDQTNGALRWLSNLDGLISLARLRQIQGDFNGAQGILYEASQYALSTESSQWDDTIVTAVAVRMALHHGDLPAAIQWWKRCGLPDVNQDIHLENYPYHIYEYLMLTQARLLTTLGRSQQDAAYLYKALGLLDSLLPEAERFRRMTSQIEILVQQAIAQSALGEARPAVINLQRALALGEPEGYRRTYLDGGQPVADLLAQCLANLHETGVLLPSTAFVESLLASFQSSVRPLRPSSGEAVSDLIIAKTEDGLPVSLSAREMEVLGLIAEGKSNQEISAQLYLALNTVKRHAYNIYTKLDAKNRTQAVSRARLLGLIR